MKSTKTVIKTLFFKIVLFNVILNPLLLSVSILCSPESSKNLGFSDVFRGYKREH